SPMDWFDPDCRTDRNAAYVKRMQAQLRELLTDYGRTDLLWFDWDGGTIPWDQDNTYRLIRTLQPWLIVNNRLDCRFGGFSADRYIGPNADYYTPEQNIGAYDDQRPWETCMTLGTQWSWKPNDKIKSVPEAIHILLKCVGGDGNLLLNVGPMPDGRIEPRQVAVLQGMGTWLKKYGKSIYGTRGGPFKPTRSIVSTRKDKTIFVHVLRWDGDVIRLPVIQGKIVSAKVLTGGKAEVQQSDDGITLRVAPEHRQEIDTIIVLRLNTSAMDEPTVSVK
ncbi:MAG: alpha-L-fucosidase, partial [Verrucomicrobiota bacterium]